MHLPDDPEKRLDPADLRDPRRTKPLVYAVKGICFTLGIELMLAGDIVVAPLEIPAEAEAALPYDEVDPRLARLGLVPRLPDANKGTFGHAMIAAGSTRYPGAARLAAEPLQLIHLGEGELPVFGTPRRRHRVAVARGRERPGVRRDLGRGHDGRRDRGIRQRSAQVVDAALARGAEMGRLHEVADVGRDAGGAVGMVDPIVGDV